MNNKSLMYLTEHRLYDELVDLYAPEDVSKSLFFEDGLRLAYHLLYNDDWNSELQCYAVELINKLRLKYPDDWQKSWKYDALLGMGYHITSQHEERYDAYKRAFDRCKQPPPGLLIEFARCSICPGIPPISYGNAIELVMQAISKIPYSDGINLLCNLYSLQNDKEKQSYWTKILYELPEGKEMHSPSIEPDFLVEEYLPEIKDKDKKI